LFTPLNPYLWIIFNGETKVSVLLCSLLFFIPPMLSGELSPDGWRFGLSFGRIFLGPSWRYWIDCRISLDVGWPIYAINMGKSSFEYPQIQRLMHSRFDEAAAYIYRHYNGTRMEGAAARFLEQKYIAWISKHGETWGPLPPDLLSMRVKQKMLQ
jgi:hypothetical protein